MVFLSWNRPKPQDQRDCINKCGTFNYDSNYHGASAKSHASVHELSKNGFAINHTRLLIGSGRHTYELGKKALQTWRHFGLKWAFVDSNTPVKVGEKICVCTKQFFPWFLLPLQIVYVNEAKSSSSSPSMVHLSADRNLKASFGFGSGTLHGHLLAGEERFSVQWDEDDQVWYEILSFSKPANLLSFVGYPYVLFMQKQFAQQSSCAVLQSVTS